jgi:hypothetical protein
VAEAYRAYRVRQVNVIHEAGQQVQRKVVQLVPQAQNCFDYCDTYYGTQVDRYFDCLGRCANAYDYLEQSGAFNQTQ